MAHFSRSSSKQETRNKPGANMSQIKKWNSRVLPVALSKNGAPKLTATHGDAKRRALMRCQLGICHFCKVKAYHSRHNGIYQELPRWNDHEKMCSLRQYSVQEHSCQLIVIHNVCVQYVWESVIESKMKLGGFNIVEVDESHFGKKCKYHRGNSKLLIDVRIGGLVE